MCLAKRSSHVSVNEILSTLLSKTIYIMYNTLTHLALDFIIYFIILLLFFQCANNLVHNYCKV